MKNKEVQELEKKLTYTRESAWKSYSEKQKEKIFAFADKYKSFLDEGKTERECVEACISRLEKNGFVNVETKEQLVPGDRVYRSIRNKGLVAAVIGTEPVVDGMNILGAHIDSPHIDLKPTPLYEDGGLALMKTHYYGGIKKYQWSTMPLAFHGIMYNSDGEKIRVNVGEDENDPVFMISELLVHLSQEQLARKASEAIKGEELNVLVGGMPMEDGEVKEGIKLAVLKLLNDKYGITEKDFMTAEIEMVPAYKAKDIGFDRSFVGAYGQDDRVCAYTSLAALMKVKNPERTCVCLFSDKEEVGSMGNSGAQSMLYENAMIELIVKTAGNCSMWDFRNCMNHSHMLSSDVTAAFDPTYASAFDKSNTAFAGSGVCLLKYTGSRGKAGSNDAHSEFFNTVANVFSKEDIPWQTGELGRVDLGGGGTIAADMANKGMNVIDCGVPVLSMHAPFEVTSKADIYSTYEGFLAFLKKMKKDIEGLA
ncbi:MAG TPA: aminopeptidase [Candidatus Scybalocola faecigallinarum]|uniref:M18 family aminopeptidase n=1 Tax=Candidatus Scybalocola faecigallinarum TaxID=2840941 RepID=A0A9D1JRZ5_9FIRM|nr:aminopeptidase [Candidatus Scybalocola faecigallinarum]